MQFNLAVRRHDMVVQIILLVVAGSMASPLQVRSNYPDRPLPIQHVLYDAQPISLEMRQSRVSAIFGDTSTSASDRSLSTFIQKKTQKAQKAQKLVAAFMSSQSTSTSSSYSKAQLQTSLGCLACETIVKTARFVVREGATEDEVTSWGTEICTKFKLGSARQCHGLVKSMAKEVVYVLSQTSIDTVSTCTSILDEDCGASGGEKWTAALPDVPKPNVSPVPTPELGAATLRILHLADVHFDPLYVAGTKTDCGESLCCHEDNGNSSDSSSAGPFGSYASCDTPLVTIESLLAHAARTHKVDYVLWTGDDSPHDIWNQTTDSHLRILDKMSELLKKYFPTTPIFPAVGNHEGNPVNSFPPPFAASQATMDWLYGPLNRTWSQWIPASDRQTTSHTILTGGFYSTTVFPGLRIISLNMNYCNNLNWWLFLNATDPLGQLSWLAQELQTSEDRSEKVHIVGHIPPGSYDCLSTWSANYYRIVNRYESTIRGQFFGHTHFDDFEVFFDLPDNNNHTNNNNKATSTGKLRPTNVAYIAPSVTMYNAANPAYRIYTVDGNHPQTTWAVLDHETYFANLTESNLTGVLKWYLLYKAKDAYKMESLQPDEWNRFIDKMQTDDSLFQLFYRHYHRASEVFPKCETDECRHLHLCNMKTARSNDHYLCD